MGVLLAFGLAREFDLLVVSDTVPLLGLFFCRFEIPKAARKTVSIAMIPEFCFMMKSQWRAPAIFKSTIPRGARVSNHRVIDLTHKNCQKGSPSLGSDLAILGRVLRIVASPLSLLSLY